MGQLEHMQEVCSFCWHSAGWCYEDQRVLQQDCNNTCLHICYVWVVILACGAFVLLTRLQCWIRMRRCPILKRTGMWSFKRKSCSQQKWLCVLSFSLFALFLPCVVQGAILSFTGMRTRSLLCPHIPCGIHVEFTQFHMDSIHSIWNYMELFWLKPHPFCINFPHSFHMEGSWNVWIPEEIMEYSTGIQVEHDGMRLESIPFDGFHNIPHGFHNIPQISHGFHNIPQIPLYFTWIPHGLHSIWIPLTPSIRSCILFSWLGQVTWLAKTS